MLESAQFLHVLLDDNYAIKCGQYLHKLIQLGIGIMYTRAPNDQSIISQYAGLCEVEINDNYQLISSHD